MKTGKKIAVSLLGIICTASLACGISACKAKKSPVGMPEHLTTVRMALPNDGSLPTAHSGLENIGYMATVLDNQPYYHSYARNSAKVMGYEQITQTWKDYKGKELSGYDSGVMICSDLSYSTFVKSGMQTCFVNNAAYMRSSSKPGKSTTATSANWNGGTPEYLDKETYLTRYGEFSTELSVYVINQDTVNDWSDVTTNEDGTYSQTFYLKNEAACYYQYKLKTNGNLKGYPDFDYINITFNFDKNWNVLSSYCEEKAKVAPKALGGAANKGTFKTDTTFYYGEGDFDNVHYAYFDDFFKNYVGKDIVGGGDKGEQKPELLDVLAGGFGKVMGEGQQFALKLKIGETDYDGKLYARLSDMSDVLNSLDVRLALEKSGSGKQDLYLEFSKGAVNVYYSNDFAITANLDAVKTVINQFSDWIKRFEKGADAANAAYTVAEEEQGGLDLGSLLASLKLTYTDDSASISLNSDNLLGTGIGAKVSLNFNRSIDEDGSNSYSFKDASLNSITYDSDSIALSLALSTDNSAVISHDTVSTAANLADYAEGVYNMLESDTLKVKIGLDGTDNKVISYLDGVKLSAEAYVALGSEIATKADIFAEYAGLSVKLSAYYDVNIHGGNYGKVYLNLTEFNGVKLDAKVYSNLNDTVTAVKQLISAVNGATPATLSEAGTQEQVNKLAGIVNGVLNMNFGKVIGSGLYASNSEIRVNVDVDEIIGALGLNLNGMQFGTAALKLNLGNKKNTSLSLGLSALGLNMSVEGSSTEITEPNAEEYLDATTLVNLVTKATEAAKEIIQAQDLVFNIDATAVVDDIPLSIRGTGEVVWKDGKMRVALDLNLSVANGTASAAKDTVALKLVYDQTVTEQDKPFVKFSVGSVAMQICKNDLSEVKDGINLIKKNIDLLINGEKTGNTTPEQAAATYGAAARSANVTESIQSVLTNENVQQVLSAVLGFVSELNVDISGKDLNNLVIKHLINGSLTLGTDNNLSLVLSAKNNNGTPILDLSASVEKGSGKKLSAVSSEIDKLEVYSTANAGEAFATVVYNYMFAMFDSLSIKNVLGSDTFAAKVFIDGSKSAISALSGVNVNAELYYTEALEGTTVEGRLVEANIELDIKGTSVKANARYSGQNLYISLDEMNGTVINGVKFTASRYDVYAAAEQLVNIITDENVIKTITKLIHPANTATSAAYAAVSADDGEKNALTDVISKLLSFDFKKAFNFGKVDGVNIATVEVDYILEALGVNAPQIGTATVGINPKTHKIDASLTLNGSAWANLTAEATSRRAYADNWQSEYIDIGFFATLINDFHNTLTDNVTGEVHSLYTFSGNVKIDVKATVIGININKSIELDVTTLTLGIDENGQFYFTLLAHLKGASVPLVGDISKDWNISVTYSNGYITFGREVGTSSEKFKVMTLDYLLDNLFVKHSDPVDSPLRWMLGMGDTLWNIIADNVNMNSGLTKPQTYEMYGSLAQASADKGNFYLSQILKGLAVNIGGNSVSNYGTDTAAAEALGLEKDYYALEINAAKLTNGLLNSLYVGLLRSEEQGIHGLCARAAMAPASAIKLDIKVNLTNYLEGVTVPEGAYPYDKWEKGEVAAPNYFNIVNGSVEGGIDFNYNFTSSDPNTTPIFGCYNTENGSYEASNVLARRILKVVDDNGNVLHEVDLAHGSTVKLLNELSPNWADEEHTQVIYYLDENGQDTLGTELILNADTIIKSAKRAATEVVFNVGVDGIKVSGAITGDLPAYPLSGYTFIGWYNEEDLVNKVTNVNDITNYENGVRTVYGLFVKSQITENGVIYTINPETREYAVTGYNSEGIKPYTKSGAVLTLAEKFVIDGRVYKVTSIAKDAFNGMGKSDENGGIGAGLKNVMVPESITLVGTNAFSENYGIESIVFFADRVGFDGTYGGKTYPLYNCSVSSGSDKTNLKIYYNDIYSTSGEGANDEGNPYWSHFYSVSSNKPRFVGGNDGGARISGNWSFVNYTQTGADINGLSCLNGGMKSDAMTAEEIEAAVVAELNARTAKNGYVNAYAVTVSGGYGANGKYYEIMVNVTEATAYYLLTVNCAAACSADYAVAEENKFALDGKVYIKAGATVTLTASADAEGVFTFDGWTGAGFADSTALSTTFVMPENSTVINAEWSADYAENTYVYSAIDYTYEGKAYSTGRQKLTNALAGGELKAPLAADSDYTFIGWAKDDNGLSFVGDVTVDEQAEATYYAIWAVKHGGAEFPVNTSGNQPTVNVSEGSFYNWYSAADSKFTGSTIPAEISVSNTVFRARLQYAVTVNFEAGSTDWYYNYSENTAEPTDITVTKGGSWISPTYTVNNGSKFGSGNCAFTLPENILEGQTVEIHRYWSNAIVIKVFNGTAAVGNYEIKGQKTNDKSNWRAQLNKDGNDYHYVKLVSSNWVLNGANANLAEVPSMEKCYYTPANTDSGANGEKIAYINNVSGTAELLFKA
ncbi:MAG: hypothetical protein K2I30_04340 [Clostridia bacterium]|nr:hypothetical protein [Clostridia bacterium]